MSSSKITSDLSPETLLQDVPRQSLQAATYARPFFLQLHNFVPHIFEDVVLQLQRITLRKNSGAAAISVFTGTKTLFSAFHPHCVRLRYERFRVAYWHTCKCTLNAWKCTARSVGGKLSGFNSFFPRTILRHSA